MKEIPLTHGKIALVDDEDYEALIRFKWQARTHDKSNTWYAYRGFGSRRRTGRNVTGLYMHRVVLGVTNRDLEVDHKNGNGLDNRKCNLRIATLTQNRFNAARYSSNTTGYKGVHFKSKTGQWGAQIQAYNKRFHLGYFDNPEEAARAYDEAAKEKHGEFARTNF